MKRATLVPSPREKRSSLNSPQKTKQNHLCNKAVRALSDTTTAAAFSVRPGLLIRHSAKQDMQTGQSEGSIQKQSNCTCSAHTVGGKKTRHLVGAVHMAVYQRFEYSTANRPKSTTEQNVTEETPSALWADHISSWNKYACWSLSENIPTTEPSSLPTSDKYKLILFSVLVYCSPATRLYH